MRYILPIFILFVLGCENKKPPKQQINESKPKKNYVFTNTIRIENLNLIFKNEKLVYPQKREVILFEDNSDISKLQEDILKKLNTKYVVTKNLYLKDYFKIKKFPTIVVLDKNKTIKYEGFIPYEILKAEGF